jgi:hypothetical protein
MNERTNINYTISEYNNVIDRLDLFYKQCQKGGGRDNHKYKKLALNMSKSAKYFKSLAEYYYRLNSVNSMYYRQLLGRLRNMSTNYQILDNEITNIRTNVENNMKHSTDKVDSLSNMVKLFEKMMKPSTTVDLLVSAKTGATGTTITDKIDINTLGLPQKGGEKTYNDVMKLVVDNKDGLIGAVQNVKFLDDKIQSLNKRMATIVEDNENLFRVRAQVEWIVNRLEECVGGDCDDATVSQDFGKLYKLIEGITTKLRDENADKQLSEYIHKLEKYVGNLENQISSSKKTMSRISGKRNNTMTNEVNSMIPPESEENKGDAAVPVTADADAAVPVTADADADAVIADAVTPVTPDTPGQRGGDSDSIFTDISGYENNSSTSFYEDQFDEEFNKSLVGGGSDEEKPAESDEDKYEGSNIFTRYQEIYAAKYKSVNKKEEIEPIKYNIQLDDLTQQEYSKTVKSMGTIKHLIKVSKQCKSILDAIQLSDTIAARKKTSTASTSLVDKIMNEGIDIKQLWEITFKYRNTEFYKNLLDKNIFVVNGDKEPKKKLLTANKYNGENLEIDIELTDKNKLIGGKMAESTLDIIDNTFVYFQCLLVVLCRFTMAMLIMNTPSGSYKEIYDEVNRMIKRMVKTDFTTYKSFDKMYEGEDVEIDSKLYLMNEEILTNMLKIITGKNLQPKLNMIEMRYYISFVDSIKNNDEETSANIGKDANKKTMELINKNKGMIEELFDLVSSQIPGKKMSYSQLITDIAKSGDETISSIGTFSELYSKLKEKIESPTGAVVEEEAGEAEEAEEAGEGAALVGGMINMSGGGVTRPRLDKFIDALINCRKQMSGFIEYMMPLEKLLEKHGNGKIENPAESNNLLKIGFLLNQTVDIGKSSYIKVIPMIFFAIEFPPALYINEKTTEYYQFEYDTADTKIKFNHIKDGDTVETTPFSGAHASFLESNGKNSTYDLLHDKVLGIKELIDAANEKKEEPINKVMNTTFALGASGTGKTSRYFGLSNGATKDKEGIVPFIIASAMEKDPSITIKMAYFICYGQGKAESTEFNELLLFMTKQNGEKNARVNSFDMDVTTSTDADKYTNFYTGLMKKNLRKVTFKDNLSKYIKGESDTYTPGSDTDGTFRHILENNDDIWMTIDSTQVSKMGDTFEDLINEQKKIFTVMPTKNNIESSRGHTCVLLKLGEKYFPLFDMAGTEDPSGIDAFFSGDGNGIMYDKAKWSKLIMSINKTSESIKENDFKIASLTDIINKSESIRRYITKSSVGGAKQAADLEKEAEKEESYPEHLLTKIAAEGYYINHTIAMLIFAVVCVGKTISSVVQDGNDTFDDIMSGVFKTIQDNNVCLIDDNNKIGEQVCDNTRYLLDVYSFNEILSKSCIWAQVLFSFMYWNEDTRDSLIPLMEDFANYNTVNNDYLLEAPIDINMPNVSNLTIETFNEKYSQEKVTNILTGLNYLLNEGMDNYKLEQDEDEEWEGYFQMKFTYKKKNFLMNATGDIKAIRVKSADEELYEYVKEKLGDSSFNIKEPRDAVYNEKIKKIEKNIRKFEAIGDKSTSINILSIYGLLKQIASEPLKAKSDAPIGIKNVIGLIIKMKDKINEQKQIPSVEFTQKTFFRQLDESILKAAATDALKGYTEITASSTFEMPPIEGFLQTISNKDSNPRATLVLALLGCFKTDEPKTEAEEWKAGYSTIQTNIYEAYKPELIEILGKIKEDKGALGDKVYTNQIKRVKDGRIAATKLTLMHLVTGQVYKKDMVINTLKLCQLLYDSTDIVKMSSMVGGYRKNKRNKRKIKYNSNMKHINRLFRMFYN